MSRKTDAYEQGLGLKVASKRCDECLFSKNKIVSDERRDAVLADCRRSGKYFICHKSTKQGTAVVCRGFFDEIPNQVCQVAKRLDVVAYVDPTTGDPVGT